MCCSNLYQHLFSENGYTGFFGIGEAVVASDSMEPKISKNDLIFYKSVDADDISVGDIVVYESTNSLGESMLIVHQVIEIDNGYITTKGIANSVPDSQFPISAVIGKYIFKINNIGGFLNLLSTKWAPLIIVLIVILLFALRIAAYYVKKLILISRIADDAETRKAIAHFFDL
jgi:signal peptidase I